MKTLQTKSFECLNLLILQNKNNIKTIILVIEFPSMLSHEIHHYCYAMFHVIHCHFHIRIFTRSEIYYFSGLKINAPLL